MKAIQERKCLIGDGKVHNRTATLFKAVLYAFVSTSIVHIENTVTTAHWTGSQDGRGAKIERNYIGLGYVDAEDVVIQKFNS